MGANVLTEKLVAKAVKDGLVIIAPQIGPQVWLLSCPYSEVLFGGARGGGKTFALLLDFYNHAVKYGKNAKGILFRRTYDELDEVKAQADEIYTPCGGRFAVGKSTWYFPNRAKLKLRYLRRDEDASHYQGHQYTWMGVDEAGNFPSAAPIDKLRATLRSKAGVPCFLRLTANPAGAGHAWIKKRFIDGCAPMTPQVDPLTGDTRVFIPSKLEDNAILMKNDPTYISRIKGSGPSWLVAAWLHGDWNASPEGGIIKAKWFQRYDGTPEAKVLVVQSWDTAYKDKQVNDPSVCTTWIVSRFGYYLIDVYRERMDYPTVKRAVKSLAAKYSPDVVLIEDKASGQSLIQELRRDTTLAVVAIEPEGDKITRAVAVSTIFEAGLVFFPESAAWLIDYEIELTIFPLATHDDQVDSTTQFLRWAHSKAIDLQAWGSGQTMIGALGSRSHVDEETGFGILRSDTDTSGF